MNRARAAAALLFAALFAVYLRCLAPNWGAMSLFNTWDGLEYVICANLLGIDHPPGHPSYLLLGKAFTLLPFGTPSWNINLLSAVFGAGAIAILFLAIVRIGAVGVCRGAVRPPCGTGEGGGKGGGGAAADAGALPIALAASLTFAFSYVFWTHCEIPEVHTLFLFLIGASVLGVIRWHGGGGRGWLALSAAALGLGLGVNLLGVFPVLIPVAAFAVISSRVRGARTNWALPAALFLAGFLAYLYYPVRLARWPGIYSHPMNYLCRFDIGSFAWYRWFLSGKAWTGGAMFFASRLLPNIPIYLKFAARDLGLPVFVLSLAGIVSGVIDLSSFVASFRRGDREEAGRRLLLPFLVALALFSLIPEISIHDPSNPRATDYLANFFLPSLFLLILPGAVTALRVNAFLRSRKRETAWIFCGLLLAMPLYTASVNRSLCDLRGEQCAYVLGGRTLSQIPEGSVIVSKLVYGLLDTYFSEVEHTIPRDKITLYDPEVVGRDLAREGAGKDLFARRNRAMLGEVSRNLAAGRPVFIAGDVVDEDKSPEKLLLSDLDLSRWYPALTPDEARLVFPRELFLYRVSGIRGAGRVDAVPGDAPRGTANDGGFSNGLTLLGFRPGAPDRRLRGDLIALDLYWKAARPLAGDVYVGMFFMDGMMRRVGEPCWHTLGGAFRPGSWKPGEIVRERVNLFPPPLGAGRYFLAVGLVDEQGDPIGYLSASSAASGKTYDYVLLVPYDNAPPPQAIPGYMPGPGAEQ
ncbi:MAG: DUF2723 domain-containing protein [Chlamydiota bacterium]